MEFLIEKDEDGGTAMLTTYSPQSHYGCPVLRVEADDCDGDFGPADELAEGLLAAEVVAGWALKEGRTDEEIEAARKFLSQWPEGPQLANA